MKKLARAIVRMRRLILIAAVLLLIPAAVGAVATPINYDILSYLPQELDSRVGQLLLETDYHLASTNMITVEGMPTNDLLAMKAEIDEVPDVLNTFWLSDVLDPAVPVEMLPADLQQFLFGKNDSTILIVQLGGSSVSEETMGAVAQIKKNTAEELLLRRHQRHPERHQGAGHGGDAPLCALRCGGVSAGALPLAGKLAHALPLHAGAALPAGV